ncbi:MAG: SH3 domain-containing protein [candidate division WOR-3 bacterium]|nr:SH3 domain-containing protein [candidate division WOR-3 bacterium]
MIGLVGALLTLVAVSVQSQPAPGQPVLRAWVIGDSCRVYEQPDPFSTILRTAEAGEPYRVLAKPPGWYEVQLPDHRTGWIVARHALLSSRPGERPGRVSGSKSEVWTAFGGALAGGCVGVVPMGAFLAYTLGSMDFFSPVHGSNAVSGTTISIAFGTWIASVVVVAPAAAAYGAFAAGERGQPGGSLAQSRAMALAGNLTGAGVGLCLDLLLSKSGSSTGPLFTSLGSLAGTTAGAIIGYERSKPAYARHYAAGRVGLPMVGLSLDRTSSGQRLPAVWVDLVSVRF